MTDDEGQTKRIPVKTGLVSSVVCFPRGVLFVCPRLSRELVPWIHVLRPYREPDAWGFAVHVGSNGFSCGEKQFTGIFS